MIDVFQMSGLVDAIVVDAVAHHLAEAEANGSVGVILQVNSSDVVADGDDYQRLLDEIEAAAVPVGVWIGPSGARAGGEVARLVTVADHSGIAPGASIGPLDDDAPGADDPRLAPIVDRRLGAEDAVAEGVVDDDSPVLGEFVLALEDAGIFPVVSEQVSGDGDLVQRQLAERIRFTKLGLWDQVFHTVASPPVAYLLFLIGLLLILLDFFTGGVGVAGVVGLVCFLLACYGLDVLGARWWAVAMLVGAVAAFAIDVQAGVPRFWTAVGAALLTAGTFTLYSNFSVWWLAAGAGIVLTLLFVVSGMPSLIRTRYSTTTIGREWMVGDLGTAVSDVDPDGVVEVLGGRWRARTNRHTPIKAGEPARVVSIEGVLLEVEPESGGAVDHRERRRARPEAAERDAPAT